MDAMAGGMGGGGSHGGAKGRPRSGGIPLCLVRGHTFAFLWVVLSGKPGQKLRRLLVTGQSLDILCQLLQKLFSLSPKNDLASQESDAARLASPLSVMGKGLAS